MWVEAKGHLGQPLKTPLSFLLPTRYFHTVVCFY